MKATEKQTAKAIKEAVKEIAVYSDNNNVININKSDLEKIASDNALSYNEIENITACYILKGYLYISNTNGVLLFKKESSYKKYYPAISRGDFRFMPAGYGHFKVTYTSPVTGNTWTRTTNNMQLVDSIKGEEFPKVQDLQTLKSFCKG